MIPLLKPSCTQAEIDAVTEVLKSGWWGQGKVVEQFEKELANRYHKKYCVTVNSATAALHLSMKLLDIHEGDEVILPALTFVSDGLAPLYVGAKPVLADIEPNTYCISPEDIARKTTENTKAVISVDFAGHPAFSEWMRSNLPFIQDAAHSCGGVSYGAMTIFSFHPVKNLATGDGGAILTDDEVFYHRAKALRWVGIDRSTWERAQKKYGWDYDIDEVGYKYHWNDLQAAIGLAQLHRLDQMNVRRHEIAMRYMNELGDKVGLPPDHPCHTWHLFVITTDERDHLIDAMLREGISAGVHYKPLYKYPMFDQTPLPNTEILWQHFVSLPIFFDLTDTEQDKIIKVIKDNT